MDEVRRLNHELGRLSRMEQELMYERQQREHKERIWHMTEVRLYENMKLLKTTIDDRIDEIVDKGQESIDGLKVIKERVEQIDEACMELENRIDKIDSMGKGLLSRSMTPMAPLSSVEEAPQELTMTELPIRIERELLIPKPWTVGVVFVPKRNQQYAFEYNSMAYRRCQSRNLHQNIKFTDGDNASFCNGIETDFGHVLKDRAWMPLVGRRAENDYRHRTALRELEQDLQKSDIWDHNFIDQHCVSHDKFDGDMLYISLQHEDLSWAEIKALPPAMDAYEACWELDNELDEKLFSLVNPFASAHGHRVHRSSTQPRELPKQVYRPVQDDAMSDYLDPPPYSSRTQSIISDRMSRLEVLANSASMVSDHSRSPRVSTAGDAETRTIRSLGDRSIRSWNTEDGADGEHRDKKPRLKSKTSEPDLRKQQPQQTVYVSGRTKRKMTVRETKAKEPVRFEWKPVSNMFHRHSNSKDEDQQGQS